MAEENVVTNGLLALYKFENNLNNSVSGSGIPGPCVKENIPNRTTSLYQDSRDGYGQALASSVAVTTPVININPYTDNYTIGCWIKRPELNSVGTIITHVDGKGNSAASPGKLLPFMIRTVINNSGLILINVSAGGKIYITARKDIPNTTEWFYVAVKKDGNTVTCSFDSDDFDALVFRGSDTLDGSNITKMQLPIGWEYGYASGTKRNNYYSNRGNVDSLRIYNRAISDIELREIKNYNPPSPPIMTTIGTQNVERGDTLNIPLSATDPDNNTIAFSFTKTGTFGGNWSNNGSTTNSVRNRNWRWVVPSSQATGIYVIKFIATAGGETSEQTVTINVTAPAASPPTLGVIGNRNVNPRTGLTVMLTATDPDTTTPGDFAWSASGPSWMVRNGNELVFSPTFANIGDIANVTATVTVGGETDSETFSVTVITPPNNPPVWAHPGNINVFTNEAVNLPLSASDADGDELTYTHDANQGVINSSNVFVDTFIAPGSYPVIFSVTDGIDTATTRVRFDVTNRPAPPPDTSPPVLERIGNQVVAPGTTKTVTMSANDPDNEALRYVPTNHPSWVTRLGNILTLSPPNSAADSTHTMTITVIADGGTPAGESDSETFTITVLPLPVVTNEPPVFAQIGDSAAALVTDNSINVRIQLSATDPEGEDIEYGVIGSDYTDSLDSDGLFTHSFNTAGNYSIIFTASDGVTTVNRVASVRIYTPTVTTASPPTLERLSNLSRIGAGGFAIRLTAKDPDNLPITFRTADNYGMFGSVSRDSNYNYTVLWTASSHPPGDRSVTFIATARGGTPRNEYDSQAVILTVVANKAPILSPIGDQNVQVGRELMIELSATDPDGHAIRFSKNSGSVGVLDDNVFTWTPTEEEIVTVEFTATDALGATDSEIIAINVEAFIPSPPRIQFIPEIIRIQENTDLVFTFTGTDPDDEEITFSVSDDRVTLSEPEDVVISDILYRRVTFTWESVPNSDPLPDDVHVITITAEADGESSSRSFQVGATSNTRPTLMIAGDTTILSGNTFRLTLTSNESDIMYDIYSGFFPGMFLDETDGSFNWTPPEIPDGAPNESYEVEFIVTDFHGLISVPRSLILTVRSRADNPFLGDESSGDYDILSGQVIAYDDNNSDDIDDWVSVISRDYGLVGRVVLDNGIIRVVIGREVNFKQVISVYRIDDNNLNGKEIFTLMPLDGNNVKVNRVNSITFKNISINQVMVNVRYGDNEYTISLGRGMPYCNITSDVKKISIHRDVNSGVSFDSTNHYVENMVVPAFRGDYTVNNPSGFGNTKYDFSKYNSYTQNFANTLTQTNSTYSRGGMTGIKRMFDNWILWGINSGTAINRYANVMCFVSTPTSVVKSESELQGHGDYPNSNFVETLITFDRPFRIALIDIPSNARADVDNNKVFINLTDEACQRVFERNFIRRRE